MRSTAPKSLGFVILCLAVPAIVLAQVNVTTYHNDPARTGQNTQETILTPSNVKSGSFGKLFSVALDGQVYAQPLILTNWSIGGGTHNVAYVSTENDSLYAIDANSGTIYWHDVLTEGGQPVPDTYTTWNNNISPVYGITGTPVIDTATNSIYLIATTDQSGSIYHRLHKLNLSTGAEQSGSPVVISGSYKSETFDPPDQYNRAALLLENGAVFIAFSNPCDTCGNGWIFSYDANSLAQDSAFSTSISTSGTVWMSGDGVAADSSGYLYLATGNGGFDGVNSFGDSIVKFGSPATSVLDYFTPNIQMEENSNDWDQGSGGLLVLPDLGSGTHPHLLVQAGKTGTIYLVDRTNMGHWCGSETCTNGNVQEILGSSGEIGGLSANLAGVWGSPAYWNGYVYFPSAQKETGLGGSIADYMKAYSFNSGGSGLLSTTPTSHTPQQFSFPGPNPTVSASGTSNGILWGLDNSGGALYAFDATNLGSQLYSSSTCGPGGPRKFSVPTVANGKVYIGGSSSLVVYGLSASQDSCVSATPPLQSITGINGGTVYYTVAASTGTNFTDGVTLSASCSSSTGKCLGISWSFNPTTVYGMGSSTLRVSSTGYPGTYTFTITGTAVSSPAHVQLNVNK